MVPPRSAAQSADAFEGGGVVGGNDDDGAARSAEVMSGAAGRRHIAARAIAYCSSRGGAQPIRHQTSRFPIARVTQTLRAPAARASLDRTHHHQHHTSPSFGPPA